MLFDFRDLSSSLAVWVDAIDFATITKDGSNLVSNWRNKGNKSVTDPVQSTTADKPAYNATGLSGRPTLDFDTTDNLFITDQAGLDYATLSIFIVGQRDDDPGSAQAMLSKYGGSTREFFCSIDGSASDVYSFTTSTNGTGGTGLNSTLSDTAGVPFIYEAHYDGTNKTAGANGAGMTQASSAALFQGTQTLLIGRTGGGDFRGKISELLMFTSTLSLNNRDIARRVLSRKWAIPLIG